MLRLKEDSREVLVSHGDFVSSSFHGTTIVWSCFDTRREKKKNASGWVRGKGTSAVDGMWVFFPCETLLCGLDSKGRGREERAQHGGESDFREVHLLELRMDLVRGWAGMRWFCRSRAVKEGRNVAGALYMRHCFQRGSWL